MDGGHGQQTPEPAQQPESSETDVLARLWAARRARDAADAETLAEVPFLADALARLTAAAADLLDVRWAALGPAQVAAAARALHRVQARLDASRVRSIKAIDDRDDVVPDARPGTAASAFLRTSLGLDRGPASLDVDAARLLDPDTGDLRQVGDAYGTGEITRAHVDVCVRVHRRLASRVREALTPVVDPATGEETERRCIEVVDAILRRQARVLSVPEFRQVADRLIEHLDPPTPGDAHQRRYLNLTQLPDGSLIGRFACGPAQALAFTAAIAAGAAPQPGTAVDEHGVEHQIPDERTPGQRRMDALVEAINLGASDAGGTEGASSAAAADPADEVADEQADERDESAEPQPEPGNTEEGGEREPQPEGDYQVRKAPGVRSGPYPTVEIIVTATLDQLAAARALARKVETAPGADPAGVWPGTSPPGSPPGSPLRPAGPLTGVEGFPRAQQGGPVHLQTLAVLACSGRLRRVLLDPHGAVLDLGRSQRLASPAQKRALLARDGGCVIAGCLVPGEHCDVHHPTPWAAGGRTDIANLALLCPRHHTEVHDGGSWEIVMINGVPWVRPPAWAHPSRPLLRNTAHRPHGTAA